MDAMDLAMSAALHAPAALAAFCFLASLWFASRMFMHMRSSRKWMSRLPGPLILAPENLFTPEGVHYFRSSKRWFRRFAYLLLGWGILVLLVHFIVRASS